MENLNQLIPQEKPLENIEFYQSFADGLAYSISKYPYLTKEKREHFKNGFESTKEQHKKIIKHLNQLIKEYETEEEAGQYFSEGFGN